MKGRLFMLLFALPFGGFGGFMLWLVGSELRDAWEMQGWVAVEAELDRAGVETRRGDDSDTYLAYAEYRYTYDTVSYTGERVAIAKGADNIGRYQQDLGNRLSRAFANGERITVWIDPEQPASSIIDRQPRWGLIAFKSVFVLVFGGVGLGLGYAALRRPTLEKAASPGFSTTPWLRNDRWQGGPLRSGSRAQMWAAWVFAAFWNLISMPLPALLLDEVTEKQNYAALLGLLFPIIGIGLLVWAIRRTREWRRIGASPLTLDPFPGAIGGHVGGHIDLRVPHTAGSAFDVTLTCLSSSISGSGKNRSRRESAKWQDRRPAFAEAGPEGTRLTFRFDVPDGLAAADAERSGERYTIWRLHLEADANGTGIDRSYDIPVYPTGELSRNLDERKLREVEVLATAATDSRLLERVRIRSTAYGRSLFYPAGRHLSMSLLGIVAGLIFAGAGGFLIMAEEATLMGSVFAFVGSAIALSSVYMLANSLEVSQDGLSIRTTRRLFGIPIKRSSMQRSAFRQLTKHSGMQSQSGNKHTVYFSIGAIDANGNEIRLGEGFQGESEAAAAMRLIARELGLPSPDDESAGGDGLPLEYNALAADN